MKRARLITPALLRGWPLPALDGRLGKEDRGHVLVVGGSAQVPGAVLLAALAALRAGAGKLQIATGKSVAGALAIAVPEARVIPLRESKRGELALGGARVLQAELSACDALLVGPGMMDGRAAIELIRHVAAAGCGTVVVDAAALDAFRRGRAPTGRRAAEGRRPGFVLTPHAGEMARLCGVNRDQVLAAPEPIAREVAAALDVVVVLKGEVTFIAAPDGRTFKNTAGNLGLGTSGSGDTLSGVIAGLAARGADPLQAAVWGVFVHARAGERLAARIAPLGFLARELLSEVPALVASMRPARHRSAPARR